MLAAIEQGAGGESKTGRRGKALQHPLLVLVLPEFVIAVRDVGANEMDTE